MVPVGPVIALMGVMAIKHFCADFLLQTTGLARGKAAQHGWFVPLLIHAGGHALITLVIALVVEPTVWWVAPAELVVHAAIDRAKAVIAYRSNLEVSMPRFWWLLGFDQLLHQLTNVAIIGVFLSVPAPI